MNIGRLHRREQPGSQCRRGGFSLVELLVTLAIISLLGVITVPIAQTAAQRTKEQELRLALREVRGAIDAYKRASMEGRIVRKIDSTGYPEDLSLLVDGVEDARDPKRSKIYFLRRIPRDPFFPDPNISNRDTWGIRSYASPPSAPKPGEDVYDVFSLSLQKGLNGIPYKEW